MRTKTHSAFLKKKAGLKLARCCIAAVWAPTSCARWVERGAHVAFGGAVTFQRSDDLRASSVMVADVERLLTETDAPYMARVPFRGIECGPEFTIFTAERIAEVRGVAPGEARPRIAAADARCGCGVFES